MTCPYFIFKNRHSRFDMNCVIENELPDISPVERIDTIRVMGRNGTLHRVYDTYDAFDYSITMQILDFHYLELVKQWLHGSGQLILGHDPDKYYEARVINAGNPIEFENQMDTFWLFTVTFELQPLKRRLSEFPLPLKAGKNLFENNGTEISSPRFELVCANQRDVRISWQGKLFTIKSPPKGTIIVDSELGLVYSEILGERKYIKSIGAYPKIYPKRNEIIVTNIEKGSILLRSAYK
ncbi:hypothetical protein [Enterococcus mundtii]|uniref:hypothetical protein n=1 Tax=Enterococcus mundtii TaxID=53346 RepID=UPI002DBA4BF5|nr:hypothetical protein [Enterococcus mundtii]MEC3941546.1 hypothetical protein [Enterococcus mundtii]